MRGGAGDVHLTIDGVFDDGIIFQCFAQSQGGGKVADKEKRRIS